MEPIQSPNKVIISPAGELIKRDFKATIQRGLIFFAPLVTLYLAPIIAVVAEEVANKSFIFTLSLFMPSQVVIGAMILYVLNRIWDMINRFIKETTYKA